ncbi:ATP-grasp domain-containing protein [Vibrio sp. V27_P1S3P104]|uniref:RimK family protein n=1 Tax=unclassified Vibrio TaxID=2614977 RepID=UPI001372F0A0|nr:MULTISPECIES: RimK family protein [unclassified Vibrio]NAW70534.1 ATP-grasp domain-containing protein [Vibrio sp. V28_P6S34P95]NAX05005.1 ATP-grasp domain-containing protein [Vibrio sp. V30_P3S12P165]NAX35043.1 ATP-grasp domain-containing protein [Vibrio sp. V29_P1S30P107]NAX36017.1 ATP-grasp domain-containing protein [Vibrio sp. V27_P1S3P104]NAX39679.1 ATP-grasp domain-containing protein [Vibrio sp. V26_P1S5P106]
MANLLIVTDQASDWQQYFPSEQVVSVDQYLDAEWKSTQRSVQVVNLCRDYDYMSTGYYCSLLAEARGHRVIPRVMAINDINQPFLLSSGLVKLNKLCKNIEAIHCKIYFGRTPEKGLEKLAQRLFEQFMVPVIELDMNKIHGQWQIHKIAPFPFQDLQDSEQDFFIESLELFSSKIWRKPKQEKKYRYDIAMLVDEEEKMPPSDASALKHFRRAANRLGMNLERLSPDDLSRLGEFDGLFIRATTNISNYTYRFAKTAEKMGLIVMDDSESIMKCTNKVFLTELLQRNHVPAPKSVIVQGFDTQWKSYLMGQLDFPMVLKIPDGAFSRGVVKVRDEQELEKEANTLFKKSALILAQAFMPTDFDWRIGVINRQAIYACKYMMSRGHWQIYQHHSSGRVSSGGFETLDLKQVPKPVVDIAVKAANLIGSGFYGVDLKEIDGQVYVIEVNDNPSIDHHVEDAFLGELLYDRIMTEFLRRIQMRGF